MRRAPGVLQRKKEYVKLYAVLGVFGRTNGTRGTSDARGTRGDTSDEYDGCCAPPRAPYSRISEPTRGPPAACSSETRSSPIDRDYEIRCDAMKNAFTLISARSHSPCSVPHAACPMQGAGANTQADRVPRRPRARRHLACRGPPGSATCAESDVRCHAPCAACNAFARRGSMTRGSQPVRHAVRRSRAPRSR